ncbi:MAG: TspO/MBR family protein, partial [Halobacteriota archaeon]
MAAGLGSSVFSINSIPTWYTSLNKPWWNPPNVVFGPVWTTLYILMGVALFLVWRTPR